MTMGPTNLLWRKAAVIGSLWAASEIILGSFLKNAHIPFAGLVLTGIGVAILVAGHSLWPVKGLLWRAGLVCAAFYRRCAALLARRGLWAGIATASLLAGWLLGAWRWSGPRAGTFSIRWNTPSPRCHWCWARCLPAKTCCFVP
jgi:hypothetical protein